MDAKILGRLGSRLRDRLDTFGEEGGGEVVLQGGIGGIQAMGLVRVVVPEADYAEARKIINEWESAQPAEAGTKPEEHSIGGGQIFVIGVVIGAWIMYWILKGPF